MSNWDPNGYFSKENTGSLINNTDNWDLNDPSYEGSYIFGFCVRDIGEKWVSAPTCKEAADILKEFYPNSDFIVMGRKNSHFVDDDGNIRSRKKLDFDEMSSHNVDPTQFYLN